MFILKLYSIQDTLGQKANVKKVSLGEINGTKNALFFLLETPTHHSFIFHVRFFFYLNCKVHVSKTVCGIFNFRFRFVFIKVFIFVQQNASTL